MKAEYVAYAAMVGQKLLEDHNLRADTIDSLWLSEAITFHWKGNSEYDHAARSIAYARKTGKGLSL